jgi:hypothetical protein
LRFARYVSKPALSMGAAASISAARALSPARSAMALLLPAFAGCDENEEEEEEDEEEDEEEEEEAEPPRESVEPAGGKSVHTTALV